MDSIIRRPQQGQKLTDVTKPVSVVLYYPSLVLCTSCARLCRPIFCERREDGKKEGWKIKESVKTRQKKGMD